MLYFQQDRQLDIRLDGLVYREKSRDTAPSLAIIPYSPFVKCFLFCRPPFFGKQCQYHNKHGHCTGNIYCTQYTTTSRAMHWTLYSIGKIYAVYVPLHAGPLYSTVHVKSAGIHYIYIQYRSHCSVVWSNLNLFSDFLNLIHCCRSCTFWGLKFPNISKLGRECAAQNFISKNNRDRHLNNEFLLKIWKYLPLTSKNNIEL